MSIAMIPYTAVKWIWIVFCIFWVLAAFVQKRNARRQTVGSRLMQMSIILLVLVPFFVEGRPSSVLYRHLYPKLLGVEYFGVLLMLLGFGFAVWARFVLGRNWSGIVTVKEDHTLITRGPYAWVRHPIYTGILLALLGTAVALGTVLNMVEVPVVALAFWLKMRTEERFMLETFGEQYTAYRRHVKALIPHVI
ncbi:MAG: isoprenylcysteine carboxylmethyltransferase family protein [Acidobacteriaceae bacterium]